MKWDFLKKFNTKVVSIIAVGAILAIGGGTALAMGISNSVKSNTEITEQEAKSTVFAHAGITENDVLSFQINKEKENGVDIYDIDFKTSDKDYNYDVQRSNGEILNFSYDVTTTNTNNSQANSQNTESGSQQNSSSSNVAGNNTSITKEQAKAIALQDAGVTEDDTQFLWAKEDYDDGRAVYEVEFYANGKEYDYEIAKDSGKIISMDYDIENYTPSGNNGDIISLEEARDLALAKVQGASANDIHIHLDRDDGQQIYEGKIYYNQMEYEFEIDASTGTFIEWSVDYWD